MVLKTSSVLFETEEHESRLIVACITAVWKLNEKFNAQLQFENNVKPTINLTESVNESKHEIKKK